MATGGEDAVRNYDLVLPTGFRASITPAPLTVTVADAHRRFGRPNPVFTILYMGFVPGEGPEVLSGELAVVTETHVASLPGKYALVLVGEVTAENYSITLAPGVLTVLPRAIIDLIPQAWREAYLAALVARNLGGTSLEITVDGAGGGVGVDPKAWVPATSSPVMATPVDLRTRMIPGMKTPKVRMSKRRMTDLYGPTDRA